MFSKIMVPIDLRHTDQMEKALDVAAEMARHHGASVTYVGVTTSQPSSVAHTPAEYTRKLKAFAEQSGAAHGFAADARVYVSHDPAVDLDDTLLKAIGEVGADLVVMQSHVPGLQEYLWPSNGGAVATHAPVSVVIVR
jgi:nucleotide-binding universal stress UspA family protein